MPANGIMEDRPAVPFDITVAKLTRFLVNAPTNIVFSSCKDSMFKVINPERVNNKRRHMITTVQPASRPPVQISGRADAPNNSQIRRILSTHIQIRPSSVSDVAI